MTDVDELLRDVGVRWRSVQPAPPSLVDPDRYRVRHRRRGWRRPVVTALVPIAVLATVVGVVLAVSGHNSGTQVVTGGAPSVPVAKPPLLSSMPATTGAFQIAAGSDGGSWSLWAKVSPLNTNPASQAPRNGLGPKFGPGLDMEIVTPQSSGGGGDDPAHMDSLVWHTYGPVPGFPTELIYGVTSVPAAQVQITIAGQTVPLVAPIYANPAFPHLRFYAIAAPSSTVGKAIVAEAISADGIPLVRTPTDLNGPPVPGAVHPPSQVALWPLPDSPTTNRASATAAATGFATDVLGVTNPKVTTTSSGSDSPAVISIVLPASGTTIKVLAVPTPNGWQIYGFLDPGRVYGITFNAGHTSVALHVPADTDSAEAVVVSAGKVDHVAIDKAELDAGSAILPEQNIQALIVIYKDVHGQTVGAGGGTY